MPKIKYRYTLTDAELKELGALITKGRHNARKIVNALILLNADAGTSPRKSRDQDIAQMLQVSEMRVHRVKQRFVEHGLEVALNGQKSQRVYKKVADGEVEAHLIALSCGAPPEGRAQWSLRLLADRAVELGYVESLSHETVRRVLKKTNSSPGKRRAGSSPRKRVRSS